MIFNCTSAVVLSIPVLSDSTKLCAPTTLAVPFMSTPVAAKAVAGTRDTTIAAAITMERNFFMGLIPPLNFSFFRVSFHNYTTKRIWLCMLRRIPPRVWIGTFGTVGFRLPHSEPSAFVAAAAAPPVCKERTKRTELLCMTYISRERQKAQVFFFKCNITVIRAR